MTYPIFAYSDSDGTFRVEQAASTGVHVRVDLDQDPELEGYGDALVIHIAEPHEVRKLADRLTEQAPERVEPMLGFVAQQRVLALKAARDVIAARTPITSGSVIPTDLITVAAYVMDGETGVES